MTISAPQSVQTDDIELVGLFTGTDTPEEAWFLVSGQWVRVDYPVLTRELTWISGQDSGPWIRASSISAFALHSSELR